MNILEEERFKLETALRIISAKIKKLKVTEKNSRKIYRNNMEYDYIKDREQKVVAINENTIIKNQIKNLEILKSNLLKMRMSPYFGKIDFVDSIGKETFYIGYGTITDDRNMKIVDWRNPIAQLFYNNKLGESSYFVENIKYDVKLTNKLQFDISRGHLKSVFKTDIYIEDLFLKEVLSKNSTQKMRNIVKTIQKEQNELIRNDSKNLLINGIAGSGKTAIALHKIAYLLYADKDLTSKEIIIFSPNKVVENYISDVLPEICSENVFTTNFKSFMNQKHKNTVYGLNKLYEETYGYAPLWKKELNRYKIVRFKGLIDRYVDHLTEILPVEDIVYNKNFKITAQEIIEYRKKILSKCALKEQYVGVFEHIKALLHQRIPNKEFVIQAIKDVKKRLQFDTYDKWIELFINKKRLLKLTRNEFEFNIIANKMDNIVNGKLNYEEGLVYLYYFFRVEGFSMFENYNIKHVIIDEIQDYNIDQLNILRNIFPEASFTMLGDENQNIIPHTKNIFEEVKKSNLFDKLKYIKTRKCYRTASNINNYINEFFDLNHFSKLKRDGNIQVHKRHENIIRELLYKNRKCKTIGIITKNKQEMYSYYKNSGYHLINRENGKIKKGINVLPAYLAKGIEFDCVIINNLGFYTMLEDKNLLYVAMTRALHSLEIIQ